MFQKYLKCTEHVGISQCVNSSLYLTVQRNIELLNGGVINYDSDKACLIQNYGQLFWYTVCN